MHRFLASALSALLFGCWWVDDCGWGGADSDSKRAEVGVR